MSGNIPLGFYMISYQVQVKIFIFYMFRITLQSRLGKYWIQGGVLVIRGQIMVQFRAPTDHHRLFTDVHKLNSLSHNYQYLVTYLTTAQ